MKEIDLAIVGGGIAGVSAGIYAKRAGLQFQLFEKKALGGQLFWIGTVDNYPGLRLGSRGEVLLENLRGSLRDLNITPVEKEVCTIELKGKKVYLYSEKEVVSICKALIVATGARFKSLGVEGEDSFLGKGVSYCAVCDGFFFKNKNIAVVGGGNTAVEEALYLSRLCKKVYLIHRRDRLRALDYLQKELFTHNNIEVVWNTTISQIKGDEFLKELVVRDTQHGGEKSLSVEGLFIAIGVSPNTLICKDVIQLDDNGFILTNEEMVTSLDSIFACGDCRRRPLRQLITAASEGAIAAISAYRYLKGRYISS